MMEFLQSAAAHAAEWLGYGFIVLLCVVAVVLSCVTLSGTWLVALAAIVAVLMPPAVPGWNLVAIFLGLAVAVEIVEWLASAWGVQKRGGSKWAGLAAFGGGLAGLFFGSWIPIPVLGSLLGMVIGGFACAYAVERRRLVAHDRALHIAWGTVTARVLVLFLKVGATLAMIVALAASILRG